MTNKAIIEALIAAVATCWDPAPTGTFDAVRAEELLNEALRLLEKEDE